MKILNEPSTTLEEFEKIKNKKLGREQLNNIIGGCFPAIICIIICGVLVGGQPEPPPPKPIV